VSALARAVDPSPENVGRGEGRTRLIY